MPLYVTHLSIFLSHYNKKADMEKLKNEFDLWRSQSESRQKVTKTYFHYYRTKRSLEFLKQCNLHEAWNKLQKRKERIQTRRVIYRITSVAASLLLIGGLFFFEQNISNSNLLALTTQKKFNEMGSRKATLTLSNGKIVDLSVCQGEISDGKGITFIHNDAKKQLIYVRKAFKGIIQYNTLSVPRGGEYTLTLADGTSIWINADSQLRFPENFSGKREVELIGEAYFEVAKDAAHPFIVHTNKGSIEVLGTHFNVSAYMNDKFHVTLAEGKVRVYNEKEEVFLSPNQQVIMNSEENLKIKDVEAKFYTSWTTGIYEFRNTELSSIINQLSRWYNVDFSFEQEYLKQKSFTGVIFRNEPLSFATDILEKVSNVRFIRDRQQIRIENMKE